MGAIFCVAFQRVPFKFHTKYLTHTLEDAILYNVKILRALRFKSHIWYWVWIYDKMMDNEIFTNYVNRACCSVKSNEAWIKDQTHLGKIILSTLLKQLHLYHQAYLQIMNGKKLLINAPITLPCMPCLLTYTWLKCIFCIMMYNYLLYFITNPKKGPQNYITLISCIIKGQLLIMPLNVTTVWNEHFLIHHPWWRPMHLSYQTRLVIYQALDLVAAFVGANAPPNMVSCHTHFQAHFTSTYTYSMA